MKLMSPITTEQISELSRRDETLKSASASSEPRGLVSGKIRFRNPESISGDLLSDSEVFWITSEGGAKCVRLFS